jgi:hypothetical protein
VNGRRWEDAGFLSGLTRRWSGYVAPCRVCGRPAFRRLRARGRGVFCDQCDRRSLGDVIDEAREGRDLRKVS